MCWAYRRLQDIAHEYMQVILKQCTMQLAEIAMIDRAKVNRGRCTSMAETPAILFAKLYNK